VSLFVESVKILRPEVAVALCSWQMSGGDERRAADPGVRGGLVTLVMQDTGEEWRIIALHNTDRSDRAR
jgi:hypothetical protein